MTSDDGRHGGGEDARPRYGHQQAWELIPWYVNGTLAAAEAEAVDEHLERCPLCRREVVANRRLALAVLRSAGEGVPTAPAAGAERLLDGTSSQRANAAGGSRRPARRLWWAPPATLAAALAAAVVAAALLASPGDAPSEPAPAAFRTLTSPAATPATAPAGSPTEEVATLRLVFTAGVSEGEVRRLLVAEQGRFVDGPSPAGVYTAVFPRAGGGGDGGEEAVATLLTRLRAAPAVALAERVHQEAAVQGDG
ncbi:MAG TPA: zf-HC2 domain-containing protein [Thermoanaerobaculia bacterium]|nr:zf-HC2 domain-containing protein [Thermoanaerobaculia bacterium]